MWFLTMCNRCSKNHQVEHNLPEFGFFFFFLNITLFLAMLCSIQDLSSQIRAQTQVPRIEAWRVNQWTASEVPRILFSKNPTICVTLDKLFELSLSNSRVERWWSPVRILWAEAHDLCAPSRHTIHSIKKRRGAYVRRHLCEKASHVYVWECVCICPHIHKDTTHTHTYLQLQRVGHNWATFTIWIKTCSRPLIIGN